MLREGGGQGPREALQLGLGGMGQDQLAPPGIRNQSLASFQPRQARADHTLNGIIQGIALNPKESSQSTRGQWTLSEGEQAHEGRGSRRQALESAQEDLAHEVEFGFQGYGLVG
jgi:hypothetical protein